MFIITKVPHQLHALVGPPLERTRPMGGVAALASKQAFTPQLYKTEHIKLVRRNARRPIEHDVRGVVCRVDDSMWGQPGRPSSAITIIFVPLETPIGPGSSCAAVRSTSAIIACISCSLKGPSGTRAASS